MAFVANPNLPENPVNLAVVDRRINREAISELCILGVRILMLQPHRSLYTAVCSHPDMLLHHIGGETIVYAPGTDPALLDELITYGFKLLKGESELSPAYPWDIAYNVARVGNKYLHNLKYTDPVIKKQLKGLDVEPIHVEQGYAKCAILPIDEKSIITSDAGIVRAAEKKGIEVLLVDSRESIQLPGLDYGFIGGVGGMLGKSVCVFNGSVDKLSGYEAVLTFLSRRNIHFKGLSKDCMTDIGSILPLMMN